jgi:hypothetical protein
MPKSVTKIRLLQALQHINHFREAQHHRDSRIMQHFLMAGMKSAFGASEAAQQEIQKINRELDLLEIPQSSAAIAALQARWKHTHNRRWHYRKKVFQIQAQHQISGLVPAETSLGDQTITHWEPSMQLPVIESDLPRMREDKPRLAAFMLDYAMQQGFDFYKEVDDAWAPTQSGEILAALPFFDWAFIWESEDHHHKQVHLSFGSGINTEAPASSAYFCACQGLPIR